METTSYEDQEIISKYFKKTLASIFINYPAILKLSGSVRGKKVLDLGCGAGWLSAEFCKRKAKVFGVDPSTKLIKICNCQNKDIEDINFAVSDGDNLKCFRNGQFDIVVANMVFLAVYSRSKLEKMFQEISRVLKKKGILIFSDCHPFTNAVGKTCTKISASNKGFDYFKVGAKYKGTFLLSDYSTIEFVDSYWSLEYYSKLLNKSGMIIEQIVEPRPVKLDPQKRLKNYRIPEYIIFKCRKTK